MLLADAGRRFGAPAPPVPTRVLDAAERLFSGRTGLEDALGHSVSFSSGGIRACAGEEAR